LDRDNDGSDDVSVSPVSAESIVESQSLAASAARLVSSLTRCTDNDGSGDVSASLAPAESAES
jgi:hypothetical protein